MPTTTSTKKEQASLSAAKPNASTTNKTGKKRKMDANVQKYYAVRAGNKPGVYLTWAECQEQTAGFRGASYKSFTSREEAEDYVAGRKTSAAADSGDKFYAVAVGREPGVYTDWDVASVAIKGWKAPKYKKFATREQAIEFIRAHGNEEAQEWLLNEGVEPPSKKAKKAKTRASPVAILLKMSRVCCEFSQTAVVSPTARGSNGGRWNVSERLGGETQTNQRAELTAVVRALELSRDDPKIRIFTDSKYTIDCSINWYKAWEKNSWRKPNGDDVLNQDLVKQIRALIDERENAGFKTLFQWVKGHSTNAGNIAADKLAVAGAKRK